MTVHQKAATRTVNKERAPIKHIQLLDDNNIHRNAAREHFELMYEDVREQDNFPA